MADAKRDMNYSVYRVRSLGDLSWLVVGFFIIHHSMNNSDHASEHVENIDDDGIDEQLPVLDAIANAFDAEYYGAWTFCTLV